MFRLWIFSLWINFRHTYDLLVNRIVIDFDHIGADDPCDNIVVTVNVSVVFHSNHLLRDMMLDRSPEVLLDPYKHRVSVNGAGVLLSNRHVLYVYLFPCQSIDPLPLLHLLLARSIQSKSRVIYQSKKNTENS